MAFLAIAIVILAGVVFWLFDLHVVLQLKTRTQNAGDAAALAAARWQGIALNLLGDLNILQAVALSVADTNTAADLAALQARLRYTCPLIGLVAAQQAAKHNGIYANAAFSAHLQAHADEVMLDYPATFAEPWTGAWEDYAGMLAAIAGEGIAAAPDNTCRYRDYNGEHVLLAPDFYDAVAGQDWCWFKWYNLELLRFYSDYTYWPALPPRLPSGTPADSEIFGLGLRTITAVLPGGLAMLTNINAIAAERGLGIVTTNVFGFATTWTVYDEDKWTSWQALASSNEFPILPLEPRPEYDYAGADAVIRVAAEAVRLTPGAGGSLVNWTAAAKPFGYLQSESGAARPDAAGLVLPAFHEVRLIPADSASGPAGGAYNLAWYTHIYEHLPNYMTGGLSGLSADCWYCAQLARWEDSEFRQGGLDWLEATDEAGELLHPCEIVGGPGGPGGGTRRGH